MDNGFQKCPANGALIHVHCLEFIHMYNLNHKNH
jgi:hypothetical protein